MALLLVVGGFVNAAGMVAPVVTWEQQLQSRFGLSSSLPVVTLLFTVAMLLVPAVVAASCGVASRSLGGSSVQWQKLTSSFVMALVPLGFSMWVAHFAYHLVAGASAIVPVLKRVAGDVGISFLGKPDWSSGAMLPLEWLTSMQILLLGAGLLLTLYVCWRTASSFASKPQNAFGLLLPWAVFAVALYAAGIWILLQPMQMRGMVM